MLAVEWRAGNALAGAEFTLYHNNPPLEAPRGADTVSGDPKTNPVQKCTTALVDHDEDPLTPDKATCTIIAVLAGEYWVVETVTPAGHNTAADQRATVVADQEVVLTFVDPRQKGALRILKNSTKGGAVNNAGAVFSYKGPGATGPTASVTDNGTADEDADVGEVCVSGLLTGSYTVNETTPPPGYGAASQTNQSATVASGTDCDFSAGNNDPAAGATATFTNPPLADIQVNFKDGGSGEASLTTNGITCQSPTGTTLTPSSTTPPSGWSGTNVASETYAGLAVSPNPRTITCTIEIDP